MGIEAKKFIAAVEEIAAEEPAYQKGHWGQDGTCDCIGLIIGAIRRAGGEWCGLHGSNYAARWEMEYLRPIAASSELKTGEAVFKAYEPGQGGYDLPDRYLTGSRSGYAKGDLRDYYHVGIVESVYPLRIRHMTSPRVRMDTSLGKWNWHGKLKKVELRTEAETRMDSVIIAGGDTSQPIHMRKAASTGAGIIADIPQESEALLIEGGGAWNQIEWNKKTGFVMAKFVTAAETAPVEMIQVPREKLEKMYDELGDLLGLRG